MSARRLLPRTLALLAVLLVVAAAALASVAGAHSLDSSTIAVRLAGDTAEATLSLAVQTLDQALPDAVGSVADGSASDGEVVAYLDEHLTVTGADGTAWAEAYTSVQRETVEGVDSLSVVVALDPGDAGTARFTLAYDAIIEAVGAHEAVVVLTDSAGEISSPGVVTASEPSLGITDGTQGAPLRDMLRFGFHHVLEGADHLLFLLVLLLPAPLVALGGRWRPGGGLVMTLRQVVHVVTAFTLGHSLTLIAAALGWVTVPSRPVEVLIAASVGVAAVHAVRPLSSGGGTAIALGFGLVHGLAFAGILSDLGLGGSTSVLALLAFNVGVELAQLATVALTLPSLHLLSRTRAYAVVRPVFAGIALLAAVGWALDRLGALDDPLAGVEEAAISHPLVIVLGLAVLAAAARLAEVARAADRGHPVAATAPRLRV